MDVTKVIIIRLTLFTSITSITSVTNGGHLGR